MTITPIAAATQPLARKNPLRTARMPAAGPIASVPLAAPAGQDIPGAGLRQMMISEYTAWLRSATTKHGRPFQEGTVRDYTETARVLHRWMTGQGHDGDFTACDAALLNTFFAAYFATHGQSGTNTRQRNLRHLFTWLEKTYGHPHPYTDALQRYSPARTRPSTLTQEFIADLLETTGGGQARDFHRARDHALIRMLTEGMRRTEVIQQETGDLSADLIARPFVRVVPLKGARSWNTGRLVPLTAATGRAVTVYLRARQSHRLELMGWTDRSMVDRYAADMKAHRPFQAKQRMGDLY